jgi:hypothetical protein
MMPAAFIDPEDVPPAELRIGVSTGELRIGVLVGFRVDLRAGHGFIFTVLTASPRSRGARHNIACWVSLAAQ